MRRTAIVFHCVVVMTALVTWALNAQAFERYKDPVSPNGPGCNWCHGDFTDGASPAGSVFPSDNKHTMHRSMTLECYLCHSAGDDRNPFIGSSAGTDSIPGYGCAGCHGRLEDEGNDDVSLGYGAGLRQHHYNAGERSCGVEGCHTDGDPGAYMPAGEDVWPPYYGNAGVNVFEPCNPSPSPDTNENWTVGDVQGLDNDGDGVYDGNDPDCGDGCTGDEECNDGNLCNGSEICNTDTGECLTIPLDCDDGNGCTDDSCDPAVGCVNADNTEPCDDGYACTTGDTCSGGSCAGGPPPDCDDGNACTEDSCDPGTGCQNPPSAAGTPCVDGDLCNGDETCSGSGDCIAGSPLVCDDGLFCDGAETCDPVGGCQGGEPPCGDSEVCDEGGDICALAAECGNGNVEPGEECDDGNQTINDGCDDGPNGNCTPTSCGNGVITVGEECDDGNQAIGDGCDDQCRREVCGNGSVEFGEECDDGNTTDGDCCSSDCQNEAEGTPCGDDDVCNGSETCTDDGVCLQGIPLVCDNNDACDGTETCDPASGCQAGTPLVCDDGLYCDGVEICDPASGCLGGEPPCETGEVCEEETDTCTSECVPELEVCDGVDNDCDGLVDEGAYLFGGFQQPVNPDGSSIFKAGSTIPIKITLTDCDGRNASATAVTVSVYKVTDDVMGAEVEFAVASSGKANTNNLFRYDMTGMKYIYNLSTKDYSAGTYMVYVTPDDGSRYSVMVSLK